MPKDTKTLGNNKARACESLGFVHKKRLCQRFDTTSSSLILKSYFRTDCVPFIVKYPKAYYFVSATVEYVTLPSFPSLLSVSA